MRGIEIPGAKILEGDINDAGATAALLRDQHWDVVVDWIAYVESEVRRDIELFCGRNRQYVFISSASAYRKPLLHPVITESKPLCNPFWEYSRNKIACDELLNRHYREEGFPMTVVRPSHTGIRRTLAWFAADPARQAVNPQTNAVMDRILQAYEK